MVVENEISEIDEELNIDKFESNLVNNMVPKHEEFSKYLEEILIL